MLGVTSQYTVILILYLLKYKMIPHVRRQNVTVINFKKHICMKHVYDYELVPQLPDDELGTNSYLIFV